MTMVIYTDGSCMTNPGPGAWACVVETEDGRSQRFAGFDPTTTSNRMELTAALEGLRRAKPGESIRIVSDSQYLVRGMADWLPRKWKRNRWRTAAGTPVLNEDLWRELDRLSGERIVEWTWTRGHVSSTQQDDAHVLAAEELDRRLREPRPFVASDAPHGSTAPVGRDGAD